MSQVVEESPGDWKPGVLESWLVVGRLMSLVVEEVPGSQMLVG
jgi:hypothetical protein